LKIGEERGMVNIIISAKVCRANANDNEKFGFKSHQYNKIFFFD